MQKKLPDYYRVRYLWKNNSVVTKIFFFIKAVMSIAVKLQIIRIVLYIKKIII